MPGEHVRRARTVRNRILAAVVAGAALIGGALVAVLPAHAVTSCTAGSTMTVVAHQDDDLLFESVNLRRDIDAGRCVRSVVVTAGDDDLGSAYYTDRESGLMDAYADMAGVADTWTGSTLTIGTKKLQLETLTAAPQLSIVFMRLPDGGVDGNGFPGHSYQSLQRLYQGTISSINTVNGSGSYTLATLKTTLLGLMTNFQPTNINTLDYTGTYGGGDHSDHYTVGYLTNLEQKLYTTKHGFAGWMGYPIANKASNLTDAQISAKEDAFFTYAYWDDQTCDTVSSCSSRPEGSWLSREYTVGTPTTTLPATPTPTPTPAQYNVTSGATVTASAQNTADQQTAAKAVDGVIDGYPGDYTAEWAAPGGGAGTWLNLAWSAARSVDQVVLYDRPNTDDQITGGTLTFSDGSTVTVPSLNNAGVATTVTFPARSTTSLRFTVTSVSGTTSNPGLAEIVVNSANAPGGATSTPTPTPTPTATPSPGTEYNVTSGATATASAQDTADQQTAAKAIDGVIDGYPGVSTAEWSAPNGGAGTWLNLAWPTARTVDQVVLYDRPNTDDQITGGTLTFSDGSTVSVPSLNNAGTATTVSFTARSTTSLRFTATSVSATTKNPGLAEIVVNSPNAPSGSTPTPTPTPTATPTPTPTPTGTPSPTLTNLARTATASASAQNTADQQTAAKAIDGVVDGYPGDYTAEWAATNGGTGTWIQLTWAKAVSLSRIVLYDRPNTSDQITGGTLTFSDGSTVAVPSLDNAGGATTITLPSAKTVTTVRLTVTSVSSTTQNVGLAEFQAFGS